MQTTPRFINGVFHFTGQGLENPGPLGALAYTVPADKRTQLIYFRAGNSTAEMVAIHLMRAGTPMRIFPIGARGAVHVPLAVVEDIEPDTKLEIFIAAPAGTTGHIVLDIGMLEI